MKKKLFPPPDEKEKVKSNPLGSKNTTAWPKTSLYYI